MVYVKQIHDGNLVGIGKYAYTPDFGEDSNRYIIITEDEYNTILEEINSKEQDIIKNDTPEFIRNNYELNISEDILLDIPYNKSNFIISTEDIYINGTYTSLSNNIACPSINGYILFRSNVESLFEESSSIELITNDYIYKFTSSENGIIVNISKNLDNIESDAISIEFLYSIID